MVKPIKNKKQYKNALTRVYDLMQKNLKPESKKFDELEILSIVIKVYEFENYTDPKPAAL